MSEILIIGAAIVLGVTLLSYVGVERYRRWSVKRKVLDVPNDRSSHNEPTPRGGGLVIFTFTIIGYLISGFFFPNYFSWGFVAGSAIIAAISIADDIRSISFHWRLLAHSIAAALVIYDLGYFQSVSVPLTQHVFSIAGFGAVLTFLWIIWMVNSYNFMDGIDGIAGIQALVASGGWGFIAFWYDRLDISILSVLVFASSLGFLIHNWSPARIFMGDIGSAFLGFVFAVIPLALINSDLSSNGYLPILAVLFMWMFLFDSVLTFIKRALRREKVWQPHRRHLYQNLVISGYSHSFVSKIYGLFASLIAFGAILAVLLTGTYWFLVVFLTVILSFMLIAMTKAKKILT